MVWEVCWSILDHSFGMGCSAETLCSVAMYYNSEANTFFIEVPLSYKLSIMQTTGWQMPQVQESICIYIQAYPYFMFLLQLLSKLNKVTDV